MAVIKSGASTDQLTIDAISKAARVTLYDTAGNVIAAFPISASSLPLPNGASTEATLALIKAKTDNLNVPLSTVGSTPASDKIISISGAAGASVTATLPAVIAKNHFITAIEITMYAIANIAGGTTPNSITTTNLPGTLNWFIDTLATKGASINRYFTFPNPLQSIVANTATTIVAPAVASVIWNMNVYYYVA